MPTTVRPGQALDARMPMRTRPYAIVTAPRTTTPRDTSAFHAIRKPEVEEHRAQAEHRVDRHDDEEQRTRSRGSPGWRCSPGPVRTSGVRRPRRRRSGARPCARSPAPAPRPRSTWSPSTAVERRRRVVSVGTRTAINRSPGCAASPPGARWLRRTMSDQNSAFCRSTAIPEPTSATRRPFSPWNSRPNSSRTSRPRKTVVVASSRKSFHASRRRAASRAPRDAGTGRR